MIRLTLRASAFFLLLHVAIPAQANFAEVVTRFEKATGARRTWLPGMSIARSLVRIAHPEGVHDFKIAIYEGKRMRSLPADFAETLRAAVGPEWRQIVNVREDGERTAIFAQETRSLVRLLVVTQEKDEATIVEALVEPEKVSAFLNKHD